MIERALREADHLRADADASLVERFDRDFVTLADFAEDVRARHPALVEDQLARAAGADAQLVFLLADAKALESTLDQERGDAAVAGARVRVGEHDEEIGFLCVRDPELAAGQQPVRPLLDGFRAHRERVASGTGFRERVSTHRSRHQARKVPTAQVVVRPVQERVDEECVLHVDEHANRRIDARERLHGQHRMKERGAGAALALGNLDGHHSQCEELVDERARNLRLLVHLAGERTHLAIGELEDAVPKETFVLGQQRQGRV